MISKTIGRQADNDLVLDHPSVAPRHAHAELASDGTVFVTGDGSHAPIFLVRGDRVLHVQRVCLCVDDRIRFGDQEIGLSQMTALFGPASGARLRHRRAPKAPGKLTRRAQVTEPGASKSPRRNPDTGTIEN